ncbi:MAG: hypothetical protein LCI00_25215 [Chloroflexi bacterium]|nr:hypothetical protein [Chloroflexota bacterium]MCC6895713.1 hypothetical protein [Anaerolineae bacterium]
MRRYLKTFLSFAFVLCVAPAMLLAQASDCPEIVSKALSAADEACKQTGRNQACYGNFNLEATGQPGAANFSFNKAGDIVNVADIQTMTLSAMKIESQEWGVALLKLQANIPDTLPGQNVTFLLFGDVEITNAVNQQIDPDKQPMEAFYLKTGAGDAQCAEAPESGLLVQTPQGVGEVAFNVNGVDVQMGSTVFFQTTETEDGMTVSTLEGAAYVTSGDDTQVILPGSWARIPVARRLVPFRSPGGGIVNRRMMVAEGAPEAPKSYKGKFPKMEALPLGMLDREIEMAAPMTDEEIAAIQDHLKSGGALCGEGPMPACEEGFVLPIEVTDEATTKVTGVDCVMPPAPGEPPLPPTERRPLCPPPDAPTGETLSIVVPTSVGIIRPGIKPPVEATSVPLIGG